MFVYEEILLILGLSMDGFAASVCLGIELGRRRAGPVVLTITGFHVGMLLMGFLLGAGVRGVWEGVFPRVAAALLILLGLNMLRTARQEETVKDGGWLSMAALAFATSIDAMTVGMALALMGASALRGACMTAVVMGILSLFGALFGIKVGEKHRMIARIAGGVVLIGLGLRMFF